MFLKLFRTTDLFIYPVADRYYYVWELVFRLLMLWIRYPTDILWLIAVLTSYIPLNLVLVLPFPRLIGFVLGVDLVELPGVFTGCMRKTIAFNLIVKTATDYNLEVSLITIKHLVPRVVLPQDFFWSSKDYSYWGLKGKY
jgi:hypothetical protein